VEIYFSLLGSVQHDPWKIVVILNKFIKIMPKRIIIFLLGFAVSNFVYILFSNKKYFKKQP